MGTVLYQDGTSVAVYFNELYYFRWEEAKNLVLLSPVEELAFVGKHETFL